VYDDLRRHFARVENPNWLLDYSGIWRKEVTFTTEHNANMAYDPDRNIVAVADQNSFYTFAVDGNRLNKHYSAKKIAYRMSANQMIHNPVDSTFSIYNLIGENQAKELSSYDFDKREWDDTYAHEQTPDYRHHNRYLSTKHNRLYIFGGYGHLKYKKGVLIYDLADKTWSTAQLTGDAPEPRYLGGLGKIDDDHLLLFGGYGSRTGDQSLQPDFYYDLFVVDLRTLRSQKIWTLEAPADNFVVSNSMIVDSANRCFYALCYPSMKFNSEISLYKFSLDKPEYEAMADRIPVKFRDTESYVDLFFYEPDQRLIAATFSPATDTTANVSIHTLSFPPLNSSDFSQPEKKPFPIPLLIVLIVSASVLAAATLVVHSVRRKKAVATSDQIAGSSVKPIKSPHGKAINLFGGFQVVDREGNDITKNFTPLLKNLFLLILLHTIKNGKGISFAKMKEILWFDKSEDSANNNRGVALNKIRQIFENVGEVQFLKKGIYWTIDLEPGIYCDYYEALILMGRIKEREATFDDICRLLSIVSAGELLPNQQMEWTDAFKSDFSNSLIDVIVPLVEREDLKFSDTDLIEIANVIFIHDPLNEDALKLKCSELVKMGKIGLAKKTYDAFVKEYSLLFATSYNLSFDQTVLRI
jgi:two-component SAPR family response regulator